MTKRKAEEDLPNERTYRWPKSDAPRYATELPTAMEAYADRHSPSFEAVKIIVGQDEDKKIFLLELGLLVAHSDFFAAALNGNWQESREREVALEEESPEAFEMFGLFLRHGKIFCSAEDVKDLLEGQTVAAIRGPQGRLEQGRLREAWCLGQALFSTSFKDAILDAYFELHKRSYSSPRPYEAWVYERTASASGLRKFVVDVGVWYDSGHFINSLGALTTPRQYFIDLAVAFHDRLKGKGPETNPLAANTPSCRYHEHVAESKPCWRTLFKV